ncbi:NAD-dependent epimerase/dehydratase family protein [Parapedobacter deserti]|uniref:NAD-dependent epimerase/dehydratase family protein n=1 Tax=Parapedobacter deserti TaxID=1912957 RepID=A0ABV7JM14_9SPHI
MEILLSGASGFLGAILNKHLTSHFGYQVTSLGHNGSKLKIDIRRPFVFDPDLYFETIIHAAGRAHSIPKTQAEKQEFYSVNFEGTKNLCLALEKLRRLPTSFIFLSSVAVYGLEEGQNITEDHPLNGASPYANSKILAENWITKWAEERDVTLGVLRLPLVAGPNPPGNLGAMISGIKSGKYLSISKANARKSIVWAEDIAKIMPVLIEKGGIYNITDGHHPSFGELEQTIAQALNKRKPLSTPYWFAKILALAGDIIGSPSPINSNKLLKMTSSLTFDDTKAQTILNWKPTPVLSKLAETLE